MKPILPRGLIVMVLMALALSALGVRAGTARPIEAVRADLAAYDPYAPGADIAIDRLLVERALARAERHAAAG